MPFAGSGEKESHHQLDQVAVPQFLRLRTAVGAPQRFHARGRDTEDDQRLRALVKRTRRAREQASKGAANETLLEISRATLAARAHLPTAINPWNLQTISS
jgi:hypothetical protein